MILDGSGVVAWRSMATRVVAIPLCGKQYGDVVRKRMLQVYVLIVSDVLEVYCKCFAWMLQN
jgi:hypothetical protein